METPSCETTSSYASSAVSAGAPATGPVRTVVFASSSSASNEPSRGSNRTGFGVSAASGSSSAPCARQSNVRVRAPKRHVRGKRVAIQSSGSASQPPDATLR